VSARFAYTQLAAWTAQWGGTVVLVYWPLRDMWFFDDSDDDDD